MPMIFLNMNLSLYVIISKKLLLHQVTQNLTHDEFQNQNSDVFNPSTFLWKCNWT